MVISSTCETRILEISLSRRAEDSRGHVRGVLYKNEVYLLIYHNLKILNTFYRKVIKAFMGEEPKSKGLKYYDIAIAVDATIKFENALIGYFSNGNVIYC